MISNNPPELKSPQPGTGKSVAVEDPVPVMDPGKPIETASSGGGTVNDPGAIDKKPPGVADLDLFV